MYGNIVRAVKIGKYGIAVVDGMLDEPQLDEREIPFAIPFYSHYLPFENNRLLAGIILENREMSTTWDKEFWLIAANKCLVQEGTGIDNVDDNMWQQLLEIFEETHL